MALQNSTNAGDWKSPPSPTTKAPSLACAERWMNDGVARATDGCRVEPDGVCPHGHQSWLLRLGLI